MQDSIPSRVATGSCPHGQEWVAGSVVMLACTLTVNTLEESNEISCSRPDAHVVAAVLLRNADPALVPLKCWVFCARQQPVEHFHRTLSSSPRMGGWQCCHAGMHTYRQHFGGIKQNQLLSPTCPRCGCGLV